MQTALRLTFRRPWASLAVLAALVGALGLAGCAEKPRQAQGKLDTPDHHVLRGNDLMEQEKWSDAENEFNLALSLDANYGPAMSGLGVVKAHQASTDTNDKDRSRHVDQAMDLADKGLSRAKDDDSKRAARVAYIRVYTYAQQPDSWLKKAENEWEKAVDLDKRKQDPDPDFFIARAYRAGFEWNKSMAAYGRVLDMNKGRQQQANDEFATVQKIVRAAPGSLHGKLVAIQPSLSRSDVAGLLVEELKISKLYSKGGQQYDTSFQAPTQAGGQMQVDTTQRMAEATDIANHPMKADIQEVMRLKVLGLEPLPDRQFHPNDTMSRAEFALMIEDILARVTGEQGLKTKYFGQRSPFPDVRGDLPYFNAVETVVTHNLMEPKDRIQGTFGPSDPVSGADALLAIRQLQNELRSYLR